MIAYNVIRLDLATARDRYPIDVPGPVLVFQRVPSPVEIRIGDRTADAILVERPGRLAACGEPLGRVYVSHPASAGTLELLVAPQLDADFFSAGSAAAPEPARPFYRAVLAAIGPANLNPPLDFAILGGSTGGPAWASTTSGATWRRGVVGAPVNGPAAFNDAQGHSGQWYLQGPLVVPVVALLHPSQTRRERLGRWAVEVSLCVQHSAGSARYYFMLGAASGAFNGLGFAAMDGGEVYAVYRLDNTDVYAAPLGVDLSVPRLLRIELGSRGADPLVRWLIDGEVRHESSEPLDLSGQFAAAAGAIVIGARAPAGVTSTLYTMMDRGLAIEYAEG